jgi:hypothetical protein
MGVAIEFLVAGREVEIGGRAGSSEAERSAATRERGAAAYVPGTAQRYAS